MTELECGQLSSCSDSEDNSSGGEEGAEAAGKKDILKSYYQILGIVNFKTSTV